MKYFIHLSYELPSPISVISTNIQGIKDYVTLGLFHYYLWTWQYTWN